MRTLISRVTEEDLNDIGVAIIGGKMKRSEAALVEWAENGDEGLAGGGGGGDCCGHGRRGRLQYRLQQEFNTLGLSTGSGQVDRSSAAEIGLGPVGACLKGVERDGIGLLSTSSSTTINSSSSNIQYIYVGISMNHSSVYVILAQF
ncbi:unnamed protein product [Dibothriocephalus latus]|uniref:SAM domain-containing protein n=1 Tax=Dibothriocephalus latus TaxID=60516 RepID=A0A3P7NCV2_DIBLA|nr:unnamed protein product [Dibothriocephalus latus]